MFMEVRTFFNTLSDTDVAAKSAQASHRLIFPEGNGTASYPVTIDGLTFVGYRDIATGEITNVHLVAP